MINSQWDLVARTYKLPSLRAYLIQRYVLDRRQASYIAHELKCTRHTVARLLKKANIPRHGPRIPWLTAKEREKWEHELSLESTNATRLNNDDDPLSEAL